MTKRTAVCLLVGYALGLTAQACSTGTADATPAAAFDRANLDTTCAPCKDFYQFANGGWLTKTTIPAAYPSYGSFLELNDRNEDVLHKILDADAAAAKGGKLETGSAGWKVGTYFASCMDTVAIDKLGVAPLSPEFNVIAAVKTAEDLKRALAVLEHRAGLAPWADGSSQDSKDAKSVIASLGQGGITLPDRDYYLKNDDRTKKIRDAYVAHMTEMFNLLGDAPEHSAEQARAVLAIETQLAQASKSRVDLRDPIANYHKMTVPELEQLTPHMPWMAFFAEQGAPTIPAVDVGQPEYFKAVDRMITAVPVADWKTFLRWRTVHGVAGSLTSAIVNENFKYTQLFSGAKELLPRWKRCSGSTDRRLGELLGQEYVKAAFTPEAKARAVSIVSNLVTELRDRIDHLDWMSAPTRTRALAKLGAFARKIGYPDKWKDYSKLEIKPGQYVANVRAADAWAAARDWAKIGQPVDRTEWGMTPPTVNAYYNPLMNEIVFPAGVLQPPFYSPSADDGINYGAMGAVIGHEMTHGFDDEGRQYDKDGNLTDWWTKADAARYNAEAAKVVRQFDSYTVLDSATHINGKLTLGENIADFGGLTVAYAAMAKALGTAPRAKVDGFTPEQRFFLGWAQVWRERSRPEYERTLVNTNEHAPGKWRVNGPYGNMPEFKAAWGCKDGDAMVRPAVERPRIW